MNKKLLTIAPVIIIVTLLAVIGYQFAKSQFAPSGTNSPNSATSGPKAGQPDQEANDPPPDPADKESKPPQTRIKKD
jgi:hypothetical protein